MKRDFGPKTFLAALSAPVLGLTMFGPATVEAGAVRADGNAWDLHDVLGNVWEWCWDIHDAEVKETYRVLRGGGWFDEHWSCRASARRRSHPTFQVDDVGFRIARSTVR